MLPSKAQQICLQPRTTSCQTRVFVQFRPKNQQKNFFDISRPTQFCKAHKTARYSSVLPACEKTAQPLGTVTPFRNPFSNSFTNSLTNSLCDYLWTINRGYSLRLCVQNRRTKRSTRMPFYILLRRKFILVLQQK